MTGFGAAQASLEGWAFKIELKAVNQKNLDVRINAPSKEAWLEPMMLAALKRRVRRGRLSVYIECAPPKAADPVAIDDTKFLALAARLGDLCTQAGVELRLEDLMAYRASFELDASGSLARPTEAKVRALCDQAVENFDRTRRQEGAAIAQMLQGHLQRLVKLVDQVHAMRPQWLQAHGLRITQRVAQLAQAQGLEPEPERIARELVWLAERSDIAEEIQRARSHTAALKELLGAPGPHGKKLDFYLQELIRETNTMASKSHDAALTDLVVQMKSLIEQMREQVANLE